MPNELWSTPQRHSAPYSRFEGNGSKHSDNVPLHRQSNQRSIPRQLSLRETELASPSFAPRRHHSDDTFIKLRRTHSTSSHKRVPTLKQHRGNTMMPIHRLPSVRFRRRHVEEQFDIDQAHSPQQHRSVAQERDYSPRQPSRQAIRQYYDSPSDHNDHSDEEIDEVVEHSHRSRRRSSRTDEEPPRKPYRSSSCRHFSVDHTLRISSSDEQAPRRTPVLERSMSEHVLGEHAVTSNRTLRGPVSHTASSHSRYRSQSWGQGEDEDQPRRHLQTGNVSVSRGGHSAHVRSPPPVMSRGGSRRTLRAQASLRSISESIDAFSDLTCEKSSNKTSNSVIEAEAPPPPLPINDESYSSSDHFLDMTSRNTMRILSYGRLEKAVEISPGIFMRLRDAKETWDAIEQGNFVSASCGQCDQSTIYSIDSASFVSCPRCKHITAIDGRRSLGGGVGLGFTPSMFRACNLVGSRYVSKEETRDPRSRNRRYDER